MNWKNTLPVAFWLFIILMVLELPSCKNKPASVEIVEATTPQTVLCDPDSARLVPDSIATRYADLYKKYIDTVPLPEGYDVSNYQVTSFSIPAGYIDTLISLKNNGVILPDSNLSAWIMLALSTSDKDKKQKITPYFVCYTGDKDSDPGALTYFNIGDPKKLSSMKRKDARNNINNDTTFINQLAKYPNLFYPYGFKFPWSDLCAIASSIDKKTANAIDAVMVIKPASKATERDTVDVFIHCYIKKGSPIASQINDGNGGDMYFDFTEPCPNNCPW